MAQYPGAAATNTTLYTAVNNKTTTLTAGIDAVVATIPVASTAGFPTSGFVTVDLEIVAYTSTDATNFLGATRGSDGSTAVPHSINALVSHNIVAAHHNALKDETIAVEDDLVAVQSALADSSPASTASTLLVRIRQIVTQIKAITGTTNWYDSVAANLTQKASTALSNLASVAINASLLPSVTNTINLGSATKLWTSLFAKNVEAGVSGDSGVVDIFPPTASKGQIQISATDSAGNFALSITNASLAAARTYTLPDAGANASFVMTEGTQTINGTKTISAGKLGGNLDANSNKITNLTNGSAAQDAAAFGQLIVFTDWASYTPTLTNFGTATNVSFYWRQVGNTIFVRGYFTTGTVAGATASISLPNSTTINLSHLPSGTNTAQLGYGERLQPGGTATAFVVTDHMTIFADGSTNDVVFYAFKWVSGGFSKANGSEGFASGDSFALEFSYPI